MKRNLLVFVLTAFAFFGAGLCRQNDKANAYDIYKIAKRDYLIFYENEIAHEKVISNIPTDELTKSADNLNVSVNKLEKVLILQHALKSMQREYTVDELLKLSNKETVKLLNEYIEWLTDNLTDEQKEELRLKLKSI